MSAADARGGAPGGNILLVSTYELGHQPLGLASPLAFLEQAGYTPEVVDLAVERLDPATVQRVGIVAVSVPMHTALRLGVRVAEQIREINPACHICFYGEYAQLNAEYLLATVADSVIGGEYEAALLELVRGIEVGEVRGVAGVSRPGHIVSPIRQRLQFPVPRRDKLPPLERYAHLSVDRVEHLVGYVQASRGCLHKCRHCPIPPVYGGRFFVVPLDVILEDVAAHVAAGARHITFGDPDFLNGPLHSLRIVEAVHSAFPSLTFDFTAKVEHLLRRRSLLPRFRELGCLFIVSAFESVSDRVLQILDKGHTRADEDLALVVTRDAGITLRPTWVAFTPWTRLDDYLGMLTFIEDNDLVDAVDPVQYAIRLLIPPGSTLLRQADVIPFIGHLDRAAFSYHWQHPDENMDSLQRDVSTMVELSARCPPEAVFERVHALAVEAAGSPAPPRIIRPVTRQAAPRLTEPWFC
ncbi:MAG: radical SAM protein [Chloroflexi bacterium]|nr:radical SAM protein [Chloroflexota bacterium]